MDSMAVQKDRNEVLKSPGFPVCFTLYADKTMLAKRGSTDGLVVRVRVDNLKDGNLTWHDIGYAPILSYCAINTKEQVKLARNELFQRFIHLIFRDIRDSECYEPSSLSNRQIIPRILSICADQPQEREFFCLMRGQSKMDCSLCNFQSMESRTFRRKVKEASMDASTTTQRLANSSVPSLPMLPIPKKNAAVNSSSCEKRDVLGTLQAQVDVAEYEIRKEKGEVICNDVWIKASKAVLKGLSALNLPPAIASTPGMLTEPGRLYETIGMDTLHTFDLGLSRQFADIAYKCFQKCSEGSGVSKSQLVRIANARIQSLPPDSDCTTLAPFKNVEQDRQANFTGKERRDLTPFLWFAVMGLNRNANPDNDPLFQTALHIDRIQAYIKGTNKSRHSRTRTIADIEKIQQEFMESADVFKDCFEVSESTKIHRLRVHTKAKLMNYGSFHVSDCSTNESIHKGIKQAYLATNKRRDRLNIQLLHINIAADVLDHLMQRKSKKDPIVVSNYRKNKDSISNLISEEKLETINAQIIPLQNQEVINACNVAIRKIRQQNNLVYEQKLFEALGNSVYDFGLNVFKPCRQIKINARFEWLENEWHPVVRQILYCGDDFKRWGMRKDAVVYQTPTTNEGITSTKELKYGILKGLFVLFKSNYSNEENTERFAIVSRLKECTADVGNTNICNQFGFKRLTYEIYGDEIAMEVLHYSWIRRKSMIVRDLYDFSKRHSILLQPSQVKETRAEREMSRFFEVKDFSYTSIGEEDIETHE